MGNPIRVLHAVVNMNRGGAETLLMNLYRNIDRTKVQFDFLTSKEGTFEEEIVQMGGRVHRIPYISDIGHFQYINQLNIFFNNNRDYKIIHSHMDKMSGLIPSAAKKSGVPIRISHSHNTRSEGGLATRIYKWFSGKYINSNATDFIACSAAAAEWLFAKNSYKTTILKNGIENSSFEYSSEVRGLTRRELGLEDGTFVFGHVGRFCTQKNHSFLLDIFSAYNKLNNNSVLILVGDGTLRKEIEIKAKKLNLDERIKFLGIRGDINRLLQAFDLFIFPSFHEGLPVSLIEAQASGLPCLISDQISEEVDMGINLIQYAPLNELQEWVRKVQIISKNPPIRRIPPSTLLENGFDIRETANEIEDFYLNAAEGCL